MVQSTCWHDLKLITVYALELEAEAVVLVFPLVFPCIFRMSCIVVHLNITTSIYLEPCELSEVSVNNISLIPNHKSMVLGVYFSIEIFSRLKPTLIVLFSFSLLHFKYFHWSQSEINNKCLSKINQIACVVYVFIHVIWM